MSITRGIDITKTNVRDLKKCKKNKYLVVF